MLSAKNVIDVEALDWASDAFWAQDQKWLRGPKSPETKTSSEVPIFCDRTKRVYYASRARLSSEYIYVFAKNGWKPRFNPRQAIILQNDAYVSFGAKGTELVAEGSAILRDISGRFLVVPKEQFAREYSVISRKGASRPVDAFSY